MDELTAERWARMRPVLARALEVPAVARPALLEELCGDDDDLRREIEALLAAEERAHRLLELPVGAVAEGLLSEIAHASPDAMTQTGERVGPYRLVRELGHGGMGTVYLAERDDGQFEQRVAVKLLRKGLATEDLLRRFLAERQILASLSHPQIARLLDGGATEDDRPYLVIEYVEGQPIDAYCDANRLTIRERLALFLSVAQAVHHAHRNLIVHRDLKPANIFVTRDGQVKVLDFGIAKLLTPQAMELTDPDTQAGYRWLTPAYAAPEQLRGGAPVTTATDVYQLGVVLYQLLTGRRPFGRKGSGAHDVERAVVEDEPPRPSIVVSETYPADQDNPVGRAKLRREIRGDLDAIVLKALRKRPALRYASAEALADDVRRYLAGQPVRARGGAATYRTRRFVHRHLAAVATAAAFIALLVAYAVTVTVQRNQIVTALGQTRLEAEKSDAVAEFLIGLFEAGNPGEGWGEDVTGGELLERAVRRAEALDAQPEVQLRLLEVIGRTYQRLAAFSKAQPLFDQSLAIRRELYGEEHLEVAKGLQEVGENHRHRGELDAAETLQTEAMQMRRRLLGEEDEELAAGLFELGQIAWRRGDHDGAERLLRQALAMQRELLGIDHAATITTLSRLGLRLWQKGDGEAAEPFIREALAARRKGGMGAGDIFVAADLNNLGLVMVDKGDLALGEALFREALAVNQRRVGEDHQFNIGKMSNLGMALWRQGRFAEADSVLRRALAIARSTVGNGHADVGLVLVQLGRLYLARKGYDDAETFLREAVEVYRGAVPEGHWRTANAEGWLGECLMELGHFTEAEPLVSASYSGLQAHWGPEHPRTQTAHARLTALYQAWDRPERVPADDAQSRPDAHRP